MHNHESEDVFGPTRYLQQTLPYPKRYHHQCTWEINIKYKMFYCHSSCGVLGTFDHMAVSLSQKRGKIQERSAVSSWDTDSWSNFCDPLGDYFDLLTVRYHSATRKRMSGTVDKYDKYGLRNP